MHQRAKAILIVFISVLCVVEGAINLSCDKVDPVRPSTLTCTCRYPNGAGILWYRNDMHVTDCFLDKKFCLPRRHQGYSFSVNKSTNEYILSLFSYNYSNCDMVTCRDISTPEVNDSKRIAARDSTSISTGNISEPTTNHTSGVLRITTEFIYGASSEVKYLDIQWLVVMDGITKPYRPNNMSIVALDRSCKQCDGDKATQFAVSFDHEEKMGCQGNEVKFRIILKYSELDLKPLNKTTKNYYCITDETSDGSTSSESYKSNIVIITILSWLFLQFIGLEATLIYKFMKIRNTSSGNLVFNGNQAKILLLSCFPFFGIIGIIPFLYSSRITEGSCTSEDRDKPPPQNKTQQPRAPTPPPRAPTPLPWAPAVYISPPRAPTPPPMAPTLPLKAPTPPPTALMLPPADMGHQKLDQNFQLANEQARDGFVAKLIKLLVGVMFAQLSRSNFPEDKHQNFIEFEKLQVSSALSKVKRMMDEYVYRYNSEQSADDEGDKEMIRMFLKDLGISEILCNFLTELVTEFLHDSDKSLHDHMLEANEAPGNDKIYIENKRYGLAEKYIYVKVRKSVVDAIVQNAIEPGNCGALISADTSDDDQDNAKLLGTNNYEEERETLTSEDQMVSLLEGLPSDTI